MLIPALALLTYVVGSHFYELYPMEDKMFYNILIGM